MTLYDILSVRPTATPEEIKKAFRDKSKACHPDKGGSDEDMARLNKAYRVLINPESRERYNATGETDKPNFDSFYTGFLQKMVIPVIGNLSEHSYRYTDIFELVRKNTKAEIRGLEQQVTTLLDKKRRQQAVVERISSDGDQILIQMLEADNKNVEQQIGQTRAIIADLNQCLERFKSYRYTTDEPSPEEVLRTRRNNFISF